MNTINAAIQSALNYSQPMDIIFAIVAAVLLYLCRRKYKVTYGIIEVVTGLYLIRLAFQVTGDFSNDFDPKDFDVVHFIVTITTYLGAIFVMVRGFDNIHSGLKARASCSNLP